MSNVVLNTPADCAALIPTQLAEAFDCKELAAALKIQLPVAQKTAYCLREMGALQMVGKRGKAFLYARV